MKTFDIFDKINNKNPLDAFFNQRKVNAHRKYILRIAQGNIENFLITLIDVGNFETSKKHYQLLQNCMDHL